MSNSEARSEANQIGTMSRSGANWAMGITAALHESNTQMTHMMYMHMQRFRGGDGGAGRLSLHYRTGGRAVARQGISISSNRDGPWPPGVVETLEIRCYGYWIMAHQ